MKIIKFPNDILRETMPIFDFDKPRVNPIEVEKVLIEAMLKNGGIGLAANQIGIRSRVFAMGANSDPTAAKAFFNPVIASAANTVEELLEGCLSFPNVYVKIKRAAKIVARWQNAQGQWEEGNLEGYDCRCFLHEYDHLEGLVFKDRISALKWNLAINKSKKGT